MAKRNNELSVLRRQAVIRQNIVSELYLHGYSYRQMAEEVKRRLDMPTCSLRTIHNDVQLLLKEWREMRNLNVDELKQVELQRIDVMIKEAWAAWEKSKLDYVAKRNKRHGKPGEGGEGDKIKTQWMEQTSEEVVACGDVRYLDLVHKLSMERRKILGLYAPEQIRINEPIDIKFGE